MSGLDFDSAVRLLYRHTSHPAGVEQAVDFLGEESSTSPSAREKLAQSENLRKLLDLLDSSFTDSATSSSIAESILRCLANALSTGDEARATVCSHGLAWAKKCLHADPTRSTLKYRTLITLFNLCFGYEEGQRCCYEENLYEDVLYYFSEKYPNIHDITPIDDAAQFGDLLLTTCEKRQAGDELKDQKTRRRLLDFALSMRRQRCEVDDLATAVEVALGCLRDEAEQANFIKDALVGKVWQMLALVEERIAHEIEAGDEENVKLLLPLSTSLTWILSDIAAHPAIAEHYSSIGDSVHIDTVSAIKAARRPNTPEDAGNPRLVSAACQVLGNLLWATRGKDLSSLSIELMDEDLYQGIMTSVTTFEEADTLHSIVGLVIQMCRCSAGYKARLSADEQLAQVLERLCHHSAKEVRQGGLKLLQLLGKEDSAIRARYTELAKQVVESLVPEQGAGPQAAIPQNGSVVELPD